MEHGISLVVGVLIGLVFAWLVGDQDRKRRLDRSDHIEF